MKSRAREVVVIEERPPSEVAYDPPFDELFRPRSRIEQTNNVEEQPPINNRLVASNTPRYSDKDMEDAEEITEEDLLTLVRQLPNGRRKAFWQMLRAFIDAGSEKGKPKPLPDWIKARARGVKLADFITETFADDLATHTMSRAKLRRYERLYQAFYDHFDQLPPNLQSIPRKGAVIDRQVAEGKVKPVPPRVHRVPRTEADRTYGREKMQLHRARQRGIVPR